MKFIITLLCLFWFSLAIADPVVVNMHEYKPVLYSEQGEVKGCGVQFSILVTTSSQQRYYLTGSINDSIPSTPTYIVSILKLTVAEAVAPPKEITTLPIHSYWMRFEDFNTLDYKRSSPYLEKSIKPSNAIVLSKLFPDPAGTTLQRLLDSHYRWLGFSLNGDIDYTFEMPIVDKNVLKTVFQCKIDMMETLIRRLDKAMKTK